jgi:hypothetical protein
LKKREGGPLTLVAAIAQHTQTLMSWNDIEFSADHSACDESSCSSEMKPSFSAKCNECQVYFTIIHPMNLAVDRIQCCFSVCVIEVVNHSWHILHFVLILQMCPLAVLVEALIFLEVSSLAPM